MVLDDSEAHNHRDTVDPANHNQGWGSGFVHGLAIRMPSANVTVPLSSSNPKEGAVSTSSVVFTPANWKIPQTVVVTGLNDHLGGDVPYSIITGAAISADPSYSGTDPANVAFVNSDTNRGEIEAAAKQEIAMAIQNEDMMASPGQGMMDMMSDDQAALALVDLHMADRIAIQSGNWSDPNTWEDRILPGPGSNVWVMPGRTVVVDKQVSDPLHTVRVSGTLSFAADRNTSLRVDTIVVDMDGYLALGTSSSPIGKAFTATVSFIDDGPTDLMWDPQLLSKGLISLGKVDIHGAQTTGHVALGKIPSPGDTQLVLAQAPINWKAGDHLVLPGTSVATNQDEQFVVTAVSADGKTLTLDHPVVNFRYVPDPSLSIYVADTTRNVIFTSENPNQIDRRGHVMFMMNPSVDVEYADFVGLGRTDKSKPIDDVGPDAVTYNAAGQIIPATGTNPKGRYAVHFHDEGGTLTSVPARVVGSVVLGSPGWGFVNHGSDVVMDDNVSVGVYGAGFVTEGGDELGSFTNNIAIAGGGRGVEFHATISEFLGDLGYSGSGFWFQGLAGISVSGNVATGSLTTASAGFIIDQNSLRTLHTYTYFPISNLRDPSVAVDGLNYGGPNYALVSDLPMLPFTNNVSYGSYQGVDVWYLGNNDRANHTDKRGVFDQVQIFDVKSDAFKTIYANSFTIQNSKIYGNDGTPYANQGSGGDRGINGNIMYSVDIVNTTVVGFWTGIQYMVGGTNHITGGYLSNYDSILVADFNQDPKIIPPLVEIISGVRFGVKDPKYQTTMYNYRQYDVMGGLAYANGINPLERFVEPVKILIDGRQLYATMQLRGYVYSGTGTVLDGLTNEQAFARYGIKVNGSFASLDATTDSRYAGLLIGSASTDGPMVAMVSSTVGSVSQIYQLVYIDLNGQTVIDPSSVTLKKGLNFIVRVINGQSRTFLVNA